MKILERLILAAGVATIAFLLWHFNPLTIWAIVSQVGLKGFLLILSFQFFDHWLNAVGWKLAFAAKDAGGVPLRLLIKARIAGDGVNYLTPSGTIAGELVRPGMLGSIKSEEIKNSSVVVAKFSQATAQAVFICLGLIFVLQGKLNFLEGRQRGFGIGAALFVIVGVALALRIVTAEGSWVARFFDRFGPGVSGIRANIRGYLRRHPARYALSILSFMLGYAWGALEVLLICHFMNIRIAPLSALAVEVLSNVVDSVMFMVPAKMGTQEAGKAAIFHGLGYAATQGLAFGLIRHTREVCWAAFGFGLYALNRRKPPHGPAGPRPQAAPLVRAD